MKSILIALILASCSTKPILPSNTDDERKWKQEYVDGKITYSEYQSRLKNEKK